MKKRFGAMLMTLLVIGVALGSWGVLSDFEAVAPLAALESEAVAVVSMEVALVGEQMFVSRSLGEEFVTSGGIKSFELYVVVVGTGALGLTLVLIWMMAKARSARRQDSGSGRVVIHDKSI